MGQSTKGKRQARTLTAIEERYKADGQGPGIEEEEGRHHERIIEGRAKILKYNVTVCRNNVLWIVPM
jgi:hypothetical protein